METRIVIVLNHEAQDVSVDITPKSETPKEEANTYEDVVNLMLGVLCQTLKNREVSKVQALKIVHTFFDEVWDEDLLLGKPN